MYGINPWYNTNLVDIVSIPARVSGNSVIYDSVTITRDYDFMPCMIRFDTSGSKLLNDLVCVFHKLNNRTYITGRVETSINMFGNRKDDVNPLSFVGIFSDTYTGNSSYGCTFKIPPYIILPIANEIVNIPSRYATQPYFDIDMYLKSFSEIQDSKKLILTIKSLDNHILFNKNSDGGFIFTRGNDVYFRYVPSIDVLNNHENHTFQGMKINYMIGKVLHRNEYLNLNRPRYGVTTPLGVVAEGGYTGKFNGSLIAKTVHYKVGDYLSNHPINAGYIINGHPNTKPRGSLQLSWLSNGFKVENSKKNPGLFDIEQDFDYIVYAE